VGETEEDLELAESREDDGMRYGFISGGVDGVDGTLGMLDECLRR